MGTVVNEGAVGWQTWPKAAMSELMIAKSGSANAIKEIKGSMTRVAFIRGEPMRRDKLIKVGRRRLHVGHSAKRHASGRHQDRQCG